MGDVGRKIHVVAGIVRDARGRVLVARRQPGKHLAGLWEFPGGKCEEGETPLDALVRELREEIGIHVEAANHLLLVPWAYPGKSVLLDVWEIVAYCGTPHPCERQPLAWVPPDRLGLLRMPAADRPVVAALRLPRQYLITPPLAIGSSRIVLAGLTRALAAGLRLTQLRLPAWSRDDLAPLARAARDVCHRYGARILLNGDWQLAVALGLDGVHLPSRTAAALTSRPDGLDWLGVSCHDEAELAEALRLKADFVTLSPIRATPDHPASAVLGWTRLAELAADFPLPIYALGGVAAADLEVARAAGAHGVAAIRDLWPL